MNNVIEKYLEWDSNFFDLKICRLIIAQETINWEAVCKNLRDKNYDLVYVFSDFPITNFVNSFDLRSFELVDIKITYELTLTSKMPINITCEDFNQTIHDIESIYELAFDSGEYSRFKIDSNFGNSKFKKLYKEWVDKSIDSTIADGVIVSKINEHIVGFITYKVEEGIITIGLIAINKDYRGKNIGTSLVNEVINRALNLKLKKLHVATQLNNILACKFYEKLNMNIYSKSNIYHLWL